MIVDLIEQQQVFALPREVVAQLFVKDDIDDGHVGQCGFPAFRLALDTGT